MSHDVENMVSAFQMPWHGLGTVTGHFLSAAEGLRLGGLDWRTDKLPIYLFDPATGQHKAVLGWSATIRDDCNPWEDSKAVLGVVRETYQPICNEAVFGLCDRLVGALGAMYETAGCLKSGKEVFIVARCPTDLDIQGDKVRPYLLATTAHDGSGALCVKLTAVRVVCANTLAMAMSENGASAWVKHTRGNVGRDGSVTDKALGQVRDDLRKNGENGNGKAIVSAASQFLKTQEERFNRLADYSMDSQSVDDYTACLFPYAPSGGTTRSDNKRDAVKQLVWSPGAMPGGESGPMRLAPDATSAYRVYNAVTQWHDHESTARQTVDRGTGQRKSAAEARFAKIVGQDRALRDDAIDILLESIDTDGESVRQALAEQKAARTEALLRQIAL